MVMMPTLHDLISNAERLARAGDDEKATSLANDLVERFPEEMEVWALRAYLHAREGQHELAIIDISHAIERNSLEPALFHDRGRYELAAGQPERAADDFGKGLELCDYHKNDYYRESLYFHRAEAFLRLKRKREALADLGHVRDDYTAWINKLRTKSELLQECGPSA
jgi:tetratricopeptide (TPR) repeat protein